MPEESVNDEVDAVVDEASADEAGADPDAAFAALAKERDELRELMKHQVVELYCPHFDKRWPAAAEQRETLLRAARVSCTLSGAAAAAFAARR